ncbi:MAG: hypothetical protein ABSC51_01495 [Gaiellaceae bacterium]|jgi:hypothetical protein
MKRVNTWLLIVGWIFAVLGGLVGMGIGAYIAFARTTGLDGKPVYKYEEESRRHGVPMLIIAFVFFAIGLYLQLKKTH